MRHQKRGRRLGRSSSHRKALLRNLAANLFLTEEDPELLDKPPRVRGRIITTLPKAKEVRPLVEKCITIARRSLKHLEEAQQYETAAERGSEAWRAWRRSDQWRRWAEARAPALAGRRRVLQLLGDKQAVRILFEEIAPRFVDRPGGYTRILKLAGPRLGDAGPRAALELVGVHDRKTVRAERPSLEDEAAPATEAAAEEQPASEAPDVAPSGEAAAGEPSRDDAPETKAETDQPEGEQEK